jgi:hypothetical protein
VLRFVLSLYKRSLPHIAAKNHSKKAMTSYCLSWLTTKTKIIYCFGALVPSIGAGDEVLLPPEVVEELPPDLAGSPQADSNNASVAVVAASAIGLSARALRGEEDVCWVDVFRMRETFKK